MADSNALRELHALIQDFSESAEPINAHGLFWLTPTNRALGFWYLAETDDDRRDLARMLRDAADAIERGD